jgi:DNA invertase Pin-like site-specific DNA recombinase
MFFQVTGAFAEFERAMIRSRVRAGLERAKARGVCLGRPKTGAKVEAVIRARLATGEGIKKVAKAVGYRATIWMRKSDNQYENL